MSNNITTQECDIRNYLAYEYTNRVKIYINNLRENMTGYKYIGKDRDGLYLYDYIPNYDKERNVFSSLLSEKCTSYIKNSEYNTNVEKDILGLFKDGEIILISEGIERIGGLIVMNVEEKNISKLFKLLSEVQGIEIKPYDRFNIKDENGLRGPYYFNEQFKRYNYNNYLEHNEDLLRTILTGESKVLKCKKAVVLTEDDIICLKYYLKNGYRYIANNVYFDGIMKYEIKGFKEEPKLTQNNIYWNYTKDTAIIYIEDELSFIHYDYPEIWDIEELLEQERVSND